MEATNETGTKPAGAQSRAGEAGANLSVGLAAGFTIIELMIVIAIVGILAAVAIHAWNNRNVPTEVLKTKDWQCLKTEEREYTYPMLLGGRMVMQTGRQEECVQWKRIGG